MEFSNQYLSYEEYGRLGGTIDQMPFNLLEFEARRKIDNKTQNRLKNVDIEDIPEEVKLCEFLMIEKMSTYDEKMEKINKNAVASESIDGYSVSYLNDNEVQEILKIKESEINSIIEETLYGVIVNGEHILYLGVK